MTQYNLFNPYIEGNMKTSVKASNQLKAACKIYQDVLAPMFLTSMPEFHFSLESEKKVYNYKVTENLKGGDVKFKIEEFNGDVDSKKLLSKVRELKNEKKQDGGKSKHKHKHKKDDDDSSDSSSSSSDESPYRFSRYCYSPYIYNPYINTGYSYTLPLFNPIYYDNSSLFWIYRIP